MARLAILTLLVSRDLFGIPALRLEAALRVLSGIQPSGRLHIGNYFGAMRQHLRMQAEHECFYFIADYHA